MVGDSPLRFWDPPGSPFTAIRLAMQPYGCKCAPWLSIVALVDCCKWLLVLNVLDCRRILFNALDYRIRQLFTYA